MKAEPSAEESLDDVIMKVPGDAAPVFEDVDPLLILPGVSSLDRQGDLVGKKDAAISRSRSRKPSRSGFLATTRIPR